MAYRNGVRSLLAASVLALTAATPLLNAPAAVAAAECYGSTQPPATPQNVEYTVTVRDDGFSQQTINARVGDLLTFRLDDAAVKPHTLDWDQGGTILRFNFDRTRDQGTCRTYGPLREKHGGGVATIHFYDADQVPGYRAGGPFTGVLTVTPTTSPTTASSTSTSSTSTTLPPSTATTTTTTPPTTATTEPTSVRPLMVPDPAPTTTTTAAPNPASAGPTKNGGTTATTANKDKDKGKGKAAGAETPTTLAVAPPAAPPDGSIFDAESLTPSPTMSAEAPPSAIDATDEAALTAESVLSLLDPAKPVGENTNARLLLMGAMGTLGLLVVIGGFWWWGHRATRWDPA